jgi:predicted alpha/beta-hydrolase family hydrolase
MTDNPHDAIRGTIDLENLRDADFATPGAQGKPLHGTTSAPDEPPHAAAVAIHGYTGHRDRNIMPVAAAILRREGIVTHRITLAHAGIREGEDRITLHDDFTRDTLDHATEDVCATLNLIEQGVVTGEELPLVLLGHSRGGSQAIRIAATAHREDWPIKPAAVIALAPPAAHTRFPEHEQRELAQKGFVERQCARAEGGSVRLGPSWFAHRFDDAGNLSPVDVFANDCRDLRCPLLVVHAANDDAVGPEHAEKIRDIFAKHNPDRFHHATIDNADHNFSAKGTLAEGIETDPETIAALERQIADFLARHIPRPETIDA